MWKRPEEVVHSSEEQANEQITVAGEHLKALTGSLSNVEDL